MKMHTLYFPQNSACDVLIGRTHNFNEIHANRDRTISAHQPHGQPENDGAERLAVYGKSDGRIGGHDLERVLLISYTNVLCLGTENTVAVTREVSSDSGKDPCFWS